MKAGIELLKYESETLEGFCPFCGALPGQQCELISELPRYHAHVERTLWAHGCLEGTHWERAKEAKGTQGRESY